MGPDSAPPAPGAGERQAPPIRVIPGSRLSQRLIGSLSPPREVQRSGLGCSREEAFSPRGCGERRGGRTLRGRDGAVFLSRSLEAALRQLRRVVRARPSVPSSAGGFLSRVLTPAAAPGCRRVGRGPGGPGRAPRLGERPPPAASLPPLIFPTAPGAIAWNCAPHLRSRMFEAFPPEWDCSDPPASRGPEETPSVRCMVNG